MSFSVVLDTCAIYPAHLRDTLLRLAEFGLYRVLWSEHILDELERNLTGNGLNPESVTHLITEMEGAFADASITGYEPLIPVLTCDPKDRHVLAAAVRANADAIITFNEVDFPPDSVDPYNIDVIHPEAFLLDLLDLSPTQVVEALHQQAAANKSAPNALNPLLDALAKAGAAGFADKVRLRAMSSP